MPEPQNQYLKLNRPTKGAHITILQLRAATQENGAKSLRHVIQSISVKEFSAMTQQKQAKNLRRDSKQHYFDMRRAATRGNQLKDLRRNSVKNIATHVEDMCGYIFIPVPLYPQHPTI